MQEENTTVSIDDLYSDWFLDYASYVILERAIPCIEDGLKPVQRRILYSLKELDDGRYNKAAHVIGHVMKYHPHGDMAIADALVKLTQKGMLIDGQGNWGNTATGDPAAAPRYIEARLTEFSKDVLFSDNVSEWKKSYDGRNKEPIRIATKFPLHLYLGSEGIAVGLSTKILPHNFSEIVQESIAYLKGFKINLLPDFPSGGIADFSDYNGGKRGGRVRLRAKFKVITDRKLEITEIPFGMTTSSIIDSILAAHDKGKLKIKKIEDNTAESISIIIYLPTESSATEMIEALYLMTDCEISIASNCCVISENKPVFISCSELLQYSVEYTKKILYAELQYNLNEINKKIRGLSLEKIFIEKKIYQVIENKRTWKSILQSISEAILPYVEKVKIKLIDDDIVKLTEIKIKESQNTIRKSLKKNC